MGDLVNSFGKSFGKFNRVFTVISGEIVRKEDIMLLLEGRRLKFNKEALYECEGVIRFTFRV